MIIQCLPEEITTTIFSKLPIRYVYRCRSVCKSWCSFIDSPTFCHMQFPNASSSTSIIVLSKPSYPHYYSHKLHIIKDDTTAIRSTISKLNLLDSSSTCFQLLGSVKGLLLLTSSEVCLYFMNHPDLFVYKTPNISLYVCNPATQEYAQLPMPNFDITDRPRCLCVLGFDVSTNKFKVVIICSRWDSGETQSRVHTLGSETWRKTSGTLPVAFSISGAIVYINGSIHWICPRSHGNPPFVIVSFDMEYEQFCLVPIPDSEFARTETDLLLDDLLLGRLGGCLCLSDCSSFAENCEIWVLKDYNVKQSWTKQFVITKYLGSRMYPISFRRNGELVLVCNMGERRVVSYNLETRTYTPLGSEVVTDWQSMSMYVAYPYVASDISPKLICTTWQD